MAGDVRRGVEALNSASVLFNHVALARNEI